MEQVENGIPAQEGKIPIGDPVTDYDSKMVALRAERHDEVRVVNIESEHRPGPDVPDSFTVAQRTETYYGPKLVLDSGTKNYLLTVPGPDCQLLLWEGKPSTNGFKKGWSKLAEVSVKFGEELPQYDLCPYCGEPLKTLEHERMAGFGECPAAEPSD
ncbi:hypothetical protein ACOZ4L_02805 [Haloplanus ruber]|uniref:Uncharacterized protein n=1 Tax=Haloplanus ruber TaxID=869892 RepID=A0ABD6D240_9EURY|nr:hypothetical protein [Haloplanus ruber]